MTNGTGARLPLDYPLGTALRLYGRRALVLVGVIFLNFLYFGMMWSVVAFPATASLVGFVAILGSVAFAIYTELRLRRVIRTEFEILEQENQTLREVSKRQLRRLSRLTALRELQVHLDRVRSVSMDLEHFLDTPAIASMPAATQPHLRELLVILKTEVRGIEDIQHELVAAR
jgi:hypothetical protein